MNEKGFTLIELLISMLILISIVTATLYFYESYSVEMNEIGEYYTAKNVTVKGAEISRENYLTSSVLSPYQDIIRVNGVNFEVVVTQEDMSSRTSLLHEGVPLIKITAKTMWKSKEVEVITYVSSP